jgi:hypothetical protein
VTKSLLFFFSITGCSNYFDSSCLDPDPLKPSSRLAAAMYPVPRLIYLLSPAFDPGRFPTSPALFPSYASSVSLPSDSSLASTYSRNFSIVSFYPGFNSDI